MGKSGDRLLREGSQGSREDRRVASVVAGDAASEVGDGKRRAWVPPDRASTRTRSLVIQSSKRYNGAPIADESKCPRSPRAPCRASGGRPRISAGRQSRPAGAPGSWPGCCGGEKHQQRPLGRRSADVRDALVVEREQGDVGVAVEVAIKLEQA